MSDSVSFQVYLLMHHLVYVESRGRKYKYGDNTAYWDVQWRHITVSSSRKFSLNLTKNLKYEWNTFSRVAQKPHSGLGRPTVEASRSHSDTPYSAALIWTRDQPVAETSTDNTQYSQETDIHIPGGIRTRNPSKQAAADLRLRMRSHLDR
jgi:hypothetical protein